MSRIHTNVLEGEADRAATSQSRPRSSIRPLGATRDSGAVPPFLHEGIASHGEELDPSVRAELEPRLGHDFGRVRVHHDPSAQRSAHAMNARAYTVGHDIVFGSGEYAPHSSAGRQLLAHELTHVVQQASGGGAPAVQWKLKAAPDASLDEFFKRFGVATEREGDEYFPGPSAAGGSTVAEVLFELLRSPRTFKVIGDTSDAAVQNLAKHVASRVGVINYANKADFKFATGANAKMSPDYWERSADKSHFDLKPGIKGKREMEAYRDPLEPDRADGYAVGCQIGAELAMRGGSASRLINDENVADDDWIPGEEGIIKNTKHTTGYGQEGQNIIYFGQGVFWGHATKNKKRTYAEWFAMVDNWQKAAKLSTHRLRPTVGIEE